jgi:radical SAM superfamily enzyme YgiQ (UPF0313 family)
VATSLYLINPASDFATSFGADTLAAAGLPAAALMGDLSTATLAALAPDDFTIELCDETLGPVDFDHPADWIGITGKINQRRRLTLIADEFRRRGRRVVIGGPLASLSPDRLRPHCDVLVRGEVEDLAAELFSDLRGGRPRAEYVGDRPDLARSPPPRWDLYPNRRALLGVLQTSRGCPFECEFCDVIQYLGRKQRHKPVGSVLTELDALHAVGYRAVFLADDNFTVHRRRAKELLDAIATWRRRQPTDLITQVSIDAARDPELLEMCVAAGLTEVFIGIETPNEASLRETKKRQNLHLDLVAATDRFLESGIAVIGGMIVGFDADGPDVFQRQYEFAMATGVPIFSLGALVAPEATPLHARMAREGRLVPDGANVYGTPWTSNIRPHGMTSEQMRDGLRWLANALYAPAAFGERLLRFIDRFGRARGGPATTALGLTTMREVDAQALQMALAVRRLGEAESVMLQRVWAAASRRVDTAPYVMRMLFQYAQIRLMFTRGQYWDPQLVESAAQSGPLPKLVA